MLSLGLSPKGGRRGPRSGSGWRGEGVLQGASYWELLGMACSPFPKQRFTQHATRFSRMSVNYISILKIEIFFKKETRIAFQFTQNKSLGGGGREIHSSRYKGRAFSRYAAHQGGGIAGQTRGQGFYCACLHGSHLPRREIHLRR